MSKQRDLIPKRVQSALLSNVCCFYEKQNDMKMARLYYEASNKLWKQHEEENQSYDGLEQQKSD